MAINYYVLNNGRLRRKENTVYVEAASGEKTPLPIENIESLYLYGEVDLNTRLLNFLSQRHITLHVFNYYGFYAGSYYPREYLNSGFLTVQQVAHYSDTKRRASLAGEFVRGSAHSLLRNLAYYDRRRPAGEVAGTKEKEPPGEIGVEKAPEMDAERDASLLDDVLGMPTFLDLEDDFVADDVDFEQALDGADYGETAVPPQTRPSLPSSETLATIRATMESLAALAYKPEVCEQVDVLRGVEGKLRERYYAAWPHILRDSLKNDGTKGDPMTTFERRVRRPPDNPVNALISFGNGHLYTVCLGEIYRTQLHPTISYLHEPGVRRFSLALDLSEIFKPLIVDRAIFRLLNTGQMKPVHFDKSLGGCYLTDAGKKIFLGALEERLSSTIKHRRLGRHVSYRHLIRLECYKLIRHLTDVEPYRAFRAWW